MSTGIPVVLRANKVLLPPVPHTSSVTGRASALCTYQCIAPLPLLEHIWDHSGDLTQPNVKFPHSRANLSCQIPTVGPSCNAGFDIAKEVTTKIFGRLLDDRQMPHSGTAVSCQFPCKVPLTSEGGGGVGQYIDRCIMVT